jgi:hypothetical protein
MYWSGGGRGGRGKRNPDGHSIIHPEGKGGTEQREVQLARRARKGNVVPRTRTRTLALALVRTPASPSSVLVDISQNRRCEGGGRPWPSSPNALPRRLLPPGPISASLLCRDKAPLSTPRSSKGWGACANGMGRIGWKYQQTRRRGGGAWEPGMGERTEGQQVLS